MTGLEFVCAWSFGGIFGIGVFYLLLRKKYRLVKVKQ
jgi:hypothetical protein